MASPRELMVYGTLITDFFGRDRSRRFIGLNARGMIFTDRKGKIKGHYGNVTQKLAQLEQQRRDTQVFSNASWVLPPRGDHFPIESQ